MVQLKRILIALMALALGALACNAPNDDAMARATDAAVAQSTLDARYRTPDGPSTPAPTATSVSGYPIIIPENVATMTPVQRLVAGDKPIDLVGWSGDSTMIALAADTNVGLIETTHWQQLRTVETPNTLSQIALSPHGYLMATVPGADGGKSALWDTQTGQPARDEISLQGVTRAAWSPDGSRLAVAKAGGVIDLINMETGRRIRSFNPHDVATDIPPDLPSPVINLWISLNGGTLAAIVQKPAYLLLWNAETGDSRGKLNFGEQVDARNVRAFVSPSWDRFVWIADNTAVLTEIETGSNIEALTFEGAVGGFDWSPDGRVMAVATSLTSSANSPVIKLIDGTTGAEIAMLTGEWPEVPKFLSFSPDGSMLAIPNGDGTVSIWAASEVAP